MKEPERISALDWEHRMAAVPEEFKAECAFLRDLVPGGVRYLYSPHEYSCRGDALLSRLKYDDSLEALRLWSFLFSEKDRLFLAKERGWKIFAVMKDLGQAPVLSYAVPKSLTFYADELWWAPCFAEEPHLLDEASALGATEELCYVRAALGAMKTLDYFPEPDLCIAGVGACCDDFSAVMQLIEWQGMPIHWWEIPARFEKTNLIRNEKFRETPHGKSPYQESAVPFLAREYRGVVRALEKTAGTKITDDALKKSVKYFNRLRGMVASLRDKVYSAARPPLPGLEMYLSEFIGIHTCSEPDESLRVLEGLHKLVDRRLENKLSPLEGDPVRIFWVTPPTDASLVTMVEDMGGCFSGTEFLISHSFFPLREDGDPVEAVAENYMDDPMIGASEFRARRIVRDAKRYGAEGVLITGIFGASHCPFEEKVIPRMVEEELDIPVVSFDVPYSPGRPSEQVANRLQGLVELLKMNRQTRVSSPGMPVESAPAKFGDPLEYFKNSIGREIDYVRDVKRRGGKVAGIYCEFTPRELILAAGAVPVCLCGTTHQTVASAETVLPANLCPLIKSSFGHILTRRDPFYVNSDIIVAETTCDGKKKMYELLAERKPVHILELTQKPEEERAFTHWLEEVRRLKQRLEAEFSVKISDDDIREAIKTMNAERGLLRKAFEYGKLDPPVVTGMELAQLRFRAAGMKSHHVMMNRFIEMLEKRRQAGETVAPRNAVRVLLTGCPTGQGTEKVIELIEESGGIVVVQESCSGMKGIEGDTPLEGDPLEAVARRHFDLPCSCMTPNTGRNELIARLAGEFDARAVVDLVWQACHTYNVESFLVEKFVRDELSLPYLKIETDYSPSDREQLRVRIQTLLELAE